MGGRVFLNSLENSSKSLAGETEIVYIGIIASRDGDPDRSARILVSKVPE